MDYKGKIYQLVCEDGYYYIGATRNELRKRLYEHKMDSENSLSRMAKHINKLGWDKVKIVLIEDFPCSNREELLRRMNSIAYSKISDKYCLNFYNHVEYNKNYYQENKEKVRERYQQNITCECGTEVRKYGLKEHKQSKKHIQLLNKKP